MSARNIGRAGRHRARSDGAIGPLARARRPGGTRARRVSGHRGTRGTAPRLWPGHSRRPGYAAPSRKPASPRVRVSPRRVRSPTAARLARPLEALVETATDCLPTFAVDAALAAGIPLASHDRPVQAPTGG